LELRVHQVAQGASGGSHVTVYEAEVELTPGGVVVEIAGVHPCDAEPRDVEAARDAIRSGAEEALRLIGSGAIIRVRRVVIHIVDFKPRQFERHTAEELHRLLAEEGRLAEPGAAADRRHHGSGES
jgi:hypothetical protein